MSRVSNGTVWRHRFGDAVLAMEVSAMKCEMYFPLECHQSAKVRTAVVPYRRKIRSSTCPNRTAMRAVYPNAHTLIKSMLTTSCTTASVERAVYQDGGVMNILAKSLRRRSIELQLLRLLCFVM